MKCEDGVIVGLGSLVKKSELVWLAAAWSRFYVEMVGNFKGHAQIILFLVLL